MNIRKRGHSESRTSNNLFSESARRMLETNTYTPVQIATDAFIEIRDSARKALNWYGSRESLSTSPNVITQREFLFNGIDTSLINSDITDAHRSINGRTRPYLSRTPSQLSLRREFSLISYENDIFDPEEIYKTQEMVQNPSDISIRKRGKFDENTQRIMYVTRLSQ